MRAMNPLFNTHKVSNNNIHIQKYFGKNDKF